MAHFLKKTAHTIDGWPGFEPRITLLSILVKEDSVPYFCTIVVMPFDF